jgi:hypothetical protein
MGFPVIPHSKLVKLPIQGGAMENVTSTGVNTVKVFTTILYGGEPEVKQGHMVLVLMAAVRTLWEVIKSVPVTFQVQVAEPMEALVRYWELLEKVDGVAI